MRFNSIKRNIGVVLTAAMIVDILYCPSVLADYYYRAVHFECHPDRGTVYAKLYTLYEHAPVPQGDFIFLDLANDARGLVCQLSAAHTIVFHAMASARTPSNDNLQVIVASHEIAALSVDSPIDDPTKNYSASIGISITKRGLLRIAKTTEYDLY